MNHAAPHVTILGLGIMGSALARSAARGGLSVTVWDRTPERARATATGGITAVDDLRKASAAGDVVVTMVPDGDAVMSIMDDGGGFAAMKTGAAWVQMSTIGLAGTGRAERLAATRSDVCLIDAPVSGSKELAESGKLVVLASGDRERAGDAVERFFAAIGTPHWLGELGAGTRMKLVFNAWIAVVMEGVAELAVLAEKLDVDLDAFTELTKGGPLVPAWAHAKLAKIRTQQTNETEFPLRWAEKDVRLALTAGDGARAGLPVLERIDQVWSDAAQTFGEADLSAVFLALQRSSGDGRT